MNTTLTLSRLAITPSRSARSVLVTLLLSILRSLTTVRDEPCALRYMAAKYAGELD